jgi:hypothetical protein
MESLSVLPTSLLSFRVSLAINLPTSAPGWDFWVLFCSSVLLPFFVNLMQSPRKTHKLKPLENEEIFDHLFVEKKQKIRVIRP